MSNIQNMPLTILVQSSILDVWQGTEYAPAIFSFFQPWTKLFHYDVPKICPWLSKNSLNLSRYMQFF